MDGSGKEAFAFRKFLLDYSKTSINQDDLESMLFMLKSKLTSRTKKKIKHGYQLFAALEQKGDISVRQRDWSILEVPLLAIKRDFQIFTAKLIEALENVDDVEQSVRIPILHREHGRRLETKFRICLTKAIEEIVESDNEDVLGQLKYLCPEIPQCELRNCKSGQELFEVLERRNLISCWDLSYLYSRLKVLGYDALCEWLKAETVNARRIISGPLDTFIKNVLIKPPPPRQLQDPKLTVFDGTTYKWLSFCVTSKNIYAILLALFIVSGILNFMKVFMEYQMCGLSTAMLNLLSRLMTHVFVPVCCLRHAKRLFYDDNREITRIGKTILEDRFLPVIERVIAKLSTPIELRELDSIQSTPVKVNTIFNSQLTLIMRSSFFVTLLYYLGILYMGASNLMTFTDIEKQVAQLLTSVSHVVVFAAHCAVSVVLSLYLFEMSLKEYVFCLEDEASKGTTSEADLVYIAREMRKVLSERWSNFFNMQIVVSGIYVYILLISVVTATPFHCYGNNVTFEESELSRIRISWLLWIVYGLICHFSIFSYRFFYNGRIIALCFQFLMLLLAIIDPMAPKWAVFIQLTIPLYPNSFSIWTHVIPCYSMWIKSYLTANPASLKDYIEVCINAFWNSSFLFHGHFAFLQVIISVLVIYSEYSLLLQKTTF